MGRLRRFPENRFVGVRGEWLVYDCDDPDEFAVLESRAEHEDLVGRNLAATFAPDTLPEARNRGFRPAGS